MRCIVATWVCTLVTCLRATSAQADVASAADELKQGYILKLKGNCSAAIPHFVTSYRLDPRPKAALNLADCEKQTGDLLAARGHAIEGRDLARQRNDTELVGVAEEQLATIDQKLPRLTIRLAPDAPKGTQVARDGTVISSNELGMAVAVNPGAHHVTATAPGHLDQEFEVTVAEGTRESLGVEPGAAIPAAPDATQSRSALPAKASHSHASMRQVLTFGALGIGALGVGAGVAVGVVAGSRHSALEGECMGNNCPLSARSDLDSFRSLKTWSTIGYAVGVVGLAGGGVLWFTAPKPGSDASALMWLGPSSAGVTGSF